MPNKDILKKKVNLVENIRDNLTSSISGVLVDFRGITVSQDTELRKIFRKFDLEYKVLKNTSLYRAIEGLSIESLKTHLTGPTSLVLSKSDELSPYKVVTEYQAKWGCIALKAGFLEGAVLTKDEVEYYAKLPSKNELVATLCGSLIALIYNLCYSLNAIIKSLAYVLNEVVGKLNNEK